QQWIRETRVTASIIVAVAFQESAYRNSKIAKQLNNHFRIKGKNNIKTIRSAYKGYSSITESYRDFVGLLQRRKATNVLFDKHESDDYESWVKGIARSGYATTNSWSPKVLATIRRYNLHRSEE